MGQRFYTFDACTTNHLEDSPLLLITDREEVLVNRMLAMAREMMPPGRQMLFHRLPFVGLATLHCKVQASTKAGTTLFTIHAALPGSN